jgi:uncharacterized NAD(P)/FAD-binding protein YdhS
MRSITVVIIGGGCSGTLTALQLLRLKENIALDIIIVERSPGIGRGLAYQVPSDRCKLNVPVQGMSAFPDEPNSFLHWMQAHDSSITGAEFVSRALYGSYLQDLARRYTEHGDSATLQTIQDEAIDLHYYSEASRWQVVLKDGSQLHADYVVVALGNIRRSTFCGVNVASTFYDPYRKETYEALRDKKRLLIVGSGLTAVDSVLEAEGHGFRGSYTMLSRHGRVPLPHEAAAHIESPIFSSPIELKKLSLRALTRLCTTESRSHGSSQGVIHALRPYLQGIWQALSGEDRRRFLRHVRPIWEVHRHRIPRPHFDTLESLKEQGRLRVTAGHLRSISRDADGVRVDIAADGANQRLSFDGSILCAGPESDPSKMDSHLVRNMLQRGLMTAGPLGLGGFINGAQLGSERLSLIGPLQRESLWEITAVREIREEAQKVAAVILQSCAVVSS